MNLGRPVAPSGPNVIEERRRADPKRDRTRLSVLLQLSRELGRGGDHLALAQRVTEVAVPALADWCAVDLRDHRGDLQRVAIRQQPHGGGGRSQLAVPMTVSGRVTGVLSLARVGDHGYDRDDLAFAEELARRVAIAIDHALCCTTRRG
ncbi:MAG: GAF domain-containing protein [Deltaproteobacteria bacterium]|nr:GAF domain-containing protein [Deltaproteobacteria bacterium]